ncbi:hypothetical protein GRFL_3392 [Christiangramia flava JLT2011]|uniref:Uncharacterized protein n=1 Tax=Christiangramia flava JLT2011 TaxID=1229726 RepID=A0A1L7I943_9FLAO|nr:hypothetical protein GRFL_3392 [Christiangramia flava JLT2011]
MFEIPFEIELNNNFIFQLFFYLKYGITKRMKSNLNSIR